MTPLVPVLLLAVASFAQPEKVQFHRGQPSGAGAGAKVTASSSDDECGKTKGQAAADQKNKSVDDAAADLQAVSGYNFTAPPSEGVEIAKKAKSKMSSTSDAELRVCVVKPMLRVVAMLGGRRAVDSEIKFWEKRGYGVGPGTRKKVDQAVSEVVKSREGSLSDSLTASAAYEVASDIIGRELIQPKWWNLISAAKGAYLRSELLKKWYDEGKKDPAQSDVNITRSLRDADLKILGFQNTGKAVMAVPMNPDTLVEAEGGWARRNYIMFSGLAAPVVLDAVAKGQLDPPDGGVEGLKKALDTEDALWGYAHLADWFNPGNAKFLDETAAKFRSGK